MSNYFSYFMIVSLFETQSFHEFLHEDSIKPKYIFKLPIDIKKCISILTGLLKKNITQKRTINWILLVVDLDCGQGLNFIPSQSQHLVKS